MAAEAAARSALDWVAYSKPITIRGGEDSIKVEDAALDVDIYIDEKKEEKKKKLELGQNDRGMWRFGASNFQPQPAERASRVWCDAVLESKIKDGAERGLAGCYLIRKKEVALAAMKHITSACDDLRMVRTAVFTLLKNQDIQKMDSWIAAGEALRLNEEMGWKGSCFYTEWLGDEKDRRLWYKRYILCK